MKRVGIIAGREVTFPESIINSINEKGNGNVVAEMATFGGIRLDEPKRYDVIIDRISHEVPYYRGTLKRMVLEGKRENVVVKLHPDVALYVLKEEKDLLKKMEKNARFGLELRDDPLLKPDEFKIVMKAQGRDVTELYALA